MNLENQRDSPKRSIETSSCELVLHRDRKALAVHIVHDMVRLETLKAVEAMQRNERVVWATL
jgi:hypothetical protein